MKHENWLVALVCLACLVYLPDQTNRINQMNQTNQNEGDRLEYQWPKAIELRYTEERS